MALRSVVPFVVVIGLSALALGGCKKDKGLRVTGIDPNVGELEGGTMVTIHGNGFTADGVHTAQVYFGGKPAEVLGFEGDDTLNVRAPAGEKDGDVVDVLIIFEPGGSRPLTKAFTYHNTKGMNVNDLDTSKTGK